MLKQLEVTMECPEKDCQKYFLAVTVLVVLPTLFREHEEHSFDMAAAENDRCPYPTVQVDSGLFSLEGTTTCVDDTR